MFIMSFSKNKRNSSCNGAGGPQVLERILLLLRYLYIKCNPIEKDRWKEIASSHHHIWNVYTFQCRVIGFYCRVEIKIIPFHNGGRIKFLIAFSFRN